MAMLILKKFLFCIQLRKGCILIGVLGVIGRTWAGIGNGIGWMYIIPLETLNPWRSVVSISNGIVGVIGGITLLHGVIKSKKSWIQMYLLITWFLVLLLSISASLGIYTIYFLCWGGSEALLMICREADDNVEMIIWTIYTLTLDIIDVFAYLYFISCVYSYLHRIDGNVRYQMEEPSMNQEHLMMS